MANYDNDFPWLPSLEEPPHKKVKERRKYPLRAFLYVLFIVIVGAVMLTYTLTSAAVRQRYVKDLQDQQATIDQLKATLESGIASGSSDFEKLEFLAWMFEQASYYADEVSEEERLEMVLKAYAAATGDAYAEYYTKEEYAELLQANVGNYVGIGVSVIQTELEVDGFTYQVFQVISIYKDAPAEGSGLRAGDYIYGVKVDGAFLSIQGLGGYTAALNEIRGEAGTDVEFLAFRRDGDGYRTEEFRVTRGAYVQQSVFYETLESDASVGIVRISEFDLTTPKQFKEAVNALLAKGVEKFVFDVRNNPGGDLQSIKAVLTYFLEEGDLILSAIDRTGAVAQSYYAEAIQMTGDYAACNVTKEEIGMYRDLNMAVLCNENTASAAEVFTATMRDYEKAIIVGETTFGKGIMQRTYNLSAVSYGSFDGYVKMTTHAYVTQCGVTYHEIGIAPDVTVSLSEEAKDYSIYVLPQALDDQLRAAVAQFHP